MSDAMMVWARQIFGLAALIPFLVPDLRFCGLSYLKTDYPAMQIGRACMSLGAGYLIFFALSRIPLAEATTLGNTRSLFIPIIASLFLKKHIENRIWACLIVGFVGVVMVFNPGREIFQPAALVALAAGAVGGGAFLMIRRLNKVEPANRITFYYFFVSTIIASLLLIGRWERPSGFDWLLMLAIGAGAALYQMCLTRAYRYARASITGGVLQISIGFSLLYQWLVFGEGVSGLAVTGMALVAGSSAAIVWTTRPKVA